MDSAIEKDGTQLQTTTLAHSRSRLSLLLNDNNMA